MHAGHGSKHAPRHQHRPAHSRDYPGARSDRGRDGLLTDGSWRGLSSAGVVGCGHRSSLGPAGPAFPAARRAGGRLARRPADHHALRPGTRQPGPARPGAAPGVGSNRDDGGISPRRPPSGRSCQSPAESVGADQPSSKPAPQVASRSCVPRDLRFRLVTAVHFRAARRGQCRQEETSLTNRDKKDSIRGRTCWAGILTQSRYPWDCSSPMQQASHEVRWVTTAIRPT